MIILENDKDHRCLAWLLEQHGQAKVDAAAATIAARGSKLFTSSLAKELKTRVPDEVWKMQGAEKILVRSKLQTLRDEFAERAALRKEKGLSF